MRIRIVQPFCRSQYHRGVRVQGMHSGGIRFPSFAGIAFLWFTGVMRDLMGDLEDKFSSTVFFGTGIILVVMM